MVLVSRSSLTRSRNRCNAHSHSMGSIPCWCDRTLRHGTSVLAELVACYAPWTGVTRRRPGGGAGNREQRSSQRCGGRGVYWKVGWATHPRAPSTAAHAPPLIRRGVGFIAGWTGARAAARRIPTSLLLDQPSDMRHALASLRPLFCSPSRRWDRPSRPSMGRNKLRQQACTIPTRPIAPTRELTMEGACTGYAIMEQLQKSTSIFVGESPKFAG